MNRTPAQASQTVKLCALAVAGIYAYRRLTEGSAEELGRRTDIAPLGEFIIGFGVTFFTLSMIAPAAPALAGNTALLVLGGSLLLNGSAAAQDLHKGLRKPIEEREAKLHPRHRGTHHQSSGTVSAQPPETRNA